MIKKRLKNILASAISIILSASAVLPIAACNGTGNTQKDYYTFVSPLRHFVDYKKRPMY